MFICIYIHIYTYIYIYIYIGYKRNQGSMFNSPDRKNGRNLDKDPFNDNFSNGTLYLLFMYTCMFILCMKYVFMCICLCIFIYLYTYTYLCMHMYVYIHIYVYIYIYIYIYMHLYMHTYEILVYS
jgi:hypothetical protein